VNGQSHTLYNSITSRYLSTGVRPYVDCEGNFAALFSINFFCLLTITRFFSAAGRTHYGVAQLLIVYCSLGVECNDYEELLPVRRKTICVCERRFAGDARVASNVVRKAWLKFYFS
jgi:hypothetical protein